MTDLSASEALAVVPLLIASFVLGFYPAPVSSQAGPVAESLGARAYLIAHPVAAAAEAEAVAAPAAPAAAPSHIAPHSAPTAP